MNTIAFVIAILVIICFVASAIYGAVYSWVQIIVDSPTGYKVLLALLSVLFIALSLQFYLGLVIVFGH